MLKSLFSACDSSTELADLVGLDKRSIDRSLSELRAQRGIEDIFAHDSLKYKNWVLVSPQKQLTMQVFC